MAGVQGMAQPEQVDQNLVEAPPVQAAPIPNMPAQRPSLDEIFAQDQQAARPSLDEIFGGGEAPEQDFWSRTGEEAVKYVKEKAADSPAGLLMSTAMDVGERLSGATAGIAEEIYKGAQGKEADLLSGAFKGLVHPHEVTPLATTYEQAFPSLGKNVTIKYRPYAGEFGTSLGTVPTDINFKPSTPIAIATDIVAGNAIVKGTTKAAAVSKLIGEGLMDFRNVFKTVKSAEQAATTLSSGAQAEQAVQSVRKLGDELAKVNGIKLTPDIINYEDAAEVAWGKSLNSNVKIQEAKNKMGEQVVAGYNKIVEGISKSSPNAENINHVVKAIQDSGNIEAAVLGDIRKAAEGYKGTQQMPVFKEKLSDLMNKVVRNADDKIDWVETGMNWGITDKDAKKLYGVVENMYNQTGSGATYSTQRKLYDNFMNKITDTVSKTAPRNSIQIRQDLRRAFVKDFDVNTEQAIQAVHPELAGQYVAKKTQVHQLYKAAEDLNTYIMENPELAGDALANALLNSKDGISQMKAIEKLMEVSKNPTYVHDLRGFLGRKILNDTVMDVSVDNPLLRYDFTKLNKNLDKYSKNGFLDALTGDPQYSANMRGFAELANRIQAQSAPMLETEAAGILGRMGYLATKVGFKPSLFNEVIKSIGRQNKISQYLTYDITKKAVTKVPQEYRAAVNQLLQDTIKLNEVKKQLPNQE